MEEIAFWFYASVMEDILPVGYFNLMVEPLVLSKIFNSLFQVIDPTQASKMKDIPSIFFVRHCISLFTEIKNESIRIAIFDLLILLGSGHESHTLLG